jgi:uncharacterized membrane protein YphA (DoxX/SURF4 family)
MKIPFLIGRILFGGYFLYNGINHFVNRSALAQYAGAKKVPKPDVAVPITGGLLIAGGASVLLGLHPKYGAAAIIAFLAGVSPVMHDFWRQDAQQRQADLINFTKNLALLGAAVALAGVEEPWPASVQAAKPGPVETAKRKVWSIAEKIAA